MCVGGRENSDGLCESGGGGGLGFTSTERGTRCVVCACVCMGISHQNPLGNAAFKKEEILEEILGGIVLARSSSHAMSRSSPPHQKKKKPIITTLSTSTHNVHLHGFMHIHPSIKDASYIIS